MTDGAIHRATLSYSCRDGIITRQRLDGTRRETRVTLLSPARLRDFEFIEYLRDNFCSLPLTLTIRKFHKFQNTDVIVVSKFVPRLDGKKSYALGKASWSLLPDNLIKFS